jgi:hypothetical protein
LLHLLGGELSLRLPDRQQVAQARGGVQLQPRGGQAFGAAGFAVDQDGLWRRKRYAV